MKIFLPWLVALALFGVAAFFFSTNRKLESETASLRETAAKVESLRSELDQLKTSGSPAQAEQIAQLRKDNQELNKLRNDVRQLRDDKQQLSQQTQQAQAQIRAAQNQVQTLSTNLQAAQLADAQRRFAERYGRPATGEADPVAACINNLRQIDGTKQQWALENKKDASAIPVIKDILPYFKDATPPKCPAGGVYALRSVAEVPTCTIAGHALPP